MDIDITSLERELATFEQMVLDDPVQALETIGRHLNADSSTSAENTLTDKAALGIRQRTMHLAAEAAARCGNDSLAGQYLRQALLMAETLEDEIAITRTRLLKCTLELQNEKASVKRQELQDIKQKLQKISEAPAELELEVAASESHLAMTAEDAEWIRASLLSLEDLIRKADPELDILQYQAMLCLAHSVEQRIAGNIDKALALSGRAIDAYAQGKNRIGRARAHLHHCIHLLMHGDTQNATVQALAGKKEVLHLQNRPFEGSMLMLLAICARRNGKLLEAIDYLEQCRAILRDHPDPINMLNCLNNLADVYNARGDYAAALKTAFEALDIETGDQHNLLRNEVTLHHIGLAYMQLGDYEKALQFYMNSLELVRKKNNPEFNIQRLGVIGRLFQRMQDHKQAESYYRQGLEISESFNNPRLKREMRLNMANLLADDGKIEQARKFYMQALEIKGEGFEPMQTAEILRGLGNILRAKGERREALRFYRQALETQEKAGATEELLNTQRLIGVALTPDDPADALKQLNHALQIAQDKKLHNSVPEILEALAQLHSNQNAPETALKYYRRYMQTMRKRFDERNAQRLSNLRVLHEVEEARHEAEVLRVKNDYLRTDLEAKEQELTNKALFVSNKNDLLQKLRHKILQAQQTPPRLMSKSIAEILTIIENSIDDKGDWLQLDERLNEAHHEFQAKLSKLYPRMSPTELRVCSLIRLNCATKDIAQIMNVSQRSAEMYRYRIRRKMALTPKENLQATLLAIT